MKIKNPDNNWIIELVIKFGGMILPVEAMELYNAVISSPEGSVVEIGSASGGTTIVLIKAAEKVGKIVYSIDPYPEEFEGNVAYYTPGLMKKLRDDFKRNILDGPYDNIVQYNEDISKCIDKIPKEISVAFIDGLHELSNVMNELNLLYPLIVDDGWVYIHDAVGAWDTGQSSRTKESGLMRIWDVIDKDIFKEIKSVGTMFCGRK